MDEKKNVKTIKQMGNSLPVGLLPRPEWKFLPKDNSFKFREWGFEQEQQIAKLKNTEKSIGRFASQVLDMMLLELGGVNWEKLGEQRVLVMNQMFMADMLHLYICLRIESIGHEFALSNLRCTSCGHEHKEFVVDLRDLDVDCLSSDEKPDQKFVYILKKPITYVHKNADGQDVEEKIESFKIGRSKWTTMEEITGEAMSNAAMTKKCILKGAIVGFNDSEGYVDADRMIGSMKKIDFELIDRFISQKNLGATIVVEDDCKNCGKKINKAVNWSYDYFFGASSLPLS